MKRKIVILDSNAVIHRAYHALPPFTTLEGVMVNAVYGYAKLLLKVIKDLKPDAVLAAFDVAGGTFRQEQYTDYKANRVAADQDLYDQIPLVHNLVEALNIPILELAGFEADDVIGTVAKQISQTEHELIIVTGDMDTMQLVQPGISVYTLKKSLNDTILFDSQAVQTKYHLRPDQIRDYKGLKGDPSDNIPGVPGIGDMRAVNLLQRFDTLEKVYEFVDRYDSFESIPKEDRVALTKSIFIHLKQYKDQAFFSRELATIVLDAPIGPVHDLVIEYVFPVEQAKEIFKKFEFFSLVKDLNEMVASPRLQTSFFQINSPSENMVAQSYQNIAQLTAQPLAIWAQADKYYAIDATGKQAQLSESELRQLFHTKQTLICADIKPILRRLYPVDLQAELADVILMAYLINPGERQLSLEAVASAYGIEYTDQTLCQQLHTIHSIVQENLQKHHLEEVYSQIERPLLPVLAKMEAIGILFDTHKLQLTQKIVDQKIVDLQNNIYALAGQEFNLNSPKQLAQILFEKLGLSFKGVKKTGGGKISTSALALENMRGEYEIVDAILQYREVAKLKSTYIDTLPLMLARDGRIHTNYQQNIAATGRLSSIDPNLQNIPTKSDLGREIKHCFVARPSWTFMACDYSQIELRLAAHLSQDKAMLEIFSQDKDFHTATAERIYGVKPEQMTKEMRTFAKTINFGILYGMGAVSLARNLKISRTEAQEFLQKYAKAYPELHAYMESLRQFALTHRYAQTEYGRIRDLSSLDIRNPRTRALLERIAVNMPIQGLQADIIKLAMIKIDDYLRDKKDIFMLLQVHDELVFEVDKRQVDHYQPVMVGIMESIYQARIPLKVGVTIQDYWG